MKTSLLVLLSTFAINAFASNVLWMKGAELYSWKDNKGSYWYALLPGTNALKQPRQILENKLNENALKLALENLPVETYVSWNATGALDKAMNLGLPPKTVIKSIQQKATQAKLTLIIN